MRYFETILGWYKVKGRRHPCLRLLRVPANLFAFVMRPWDAAVWWSIEPSLTFDRDMWRVSRGEKKPFRPTTKQMFALMVLRSQPDWLADLGAASTLIRTLNGDNRRPKKK